MSLPDGVLRLPDGSPVTRDDETTGDWLTEQASAEAFEAAITPSGLFRVYREVAGILIQPRPSQVDKTMRIDRLLVPTAKLSAIGWAYGAIGVEIKRSGVKIGPPLAQAMDYTRGVWPIRGILVQLGAVFLWPCGKQHGPVASLMAHNRVGTVSTSPWVSAYFQFGEETILRIDKSGQVTSRYTGLPHVGNGLSGRKVGSR
jgi:hypothetical protein